MFANFRQWWKQSSKAAKSRRLRLAERRVTLSLEPLEARVLLSSIFWVNRGQESDGFNAVFGARADDARVVVDSALYAWQRVINNFNYSDGSNTLKVTIGMDTSSYTNGAGANPNDITFDATGKPETGTLILGSGSDGHGGGWFLDNANVPEDMFAAY